MLHLFFCVSGVFFCLLCYVRGFWLVYWFGVWGFLCGEGYYLISVLNFTTQVPYVVEMNMSPGDMKSFC